MINNAKQCKIIDRRSVRRARLFSGLMRILLRFLVVLMFVPGLRFLAAANSMQNNAKQC